MNLLVMLAQATAPTTGAQPAPGPIEMLRTFFPLLIILGVFFYLMNRNKRTQDKQKKSMLEELKRGARIQTIGGLLGTVVDVRDDEVQVKIDEGNNTKAWFTRNAIHRVLDKDKDKVETK